jgi:hypothetical protein
VNPAYQSRPVTWLRALLCVTVTALLFVPTGAGVVSAQQSREEIQATPVAPFTAFQSQRSSQRIDAAKQGLSLDTPFLLAAEEGVAARYARAVVAGEHHRLASISAVERQSGRAPPSRNFLSQQ